MPISFTRSHLFAALLATTLNVPECPGAFMAVLVEKLKGRKMTSRIQLGRQGECLAASFLRKAGYTILKTNFRCHVGELDIVAKHDGYLVFVEVKTRSGIRYGLPEEAISPAKKYRLARAAQLFQLVNGLKGMPCRFDVVSILCDDSACRDIRLLQDAFQVSA